MRQFLEWILDKQPESSSNPLVDYHWNFGPEKMIKISEKVGPLDHLLLPLVQSGVCTQHFSCKIPLLSGGVVREFASVTRGGHCLYMYTCVCRAQLCWFGCGRQWHIRVYFEGEVAYVEMKSYVPFNTRMRC